MKKLVERKKKGRGKQAQDEKNLLGPVWIDEKMLMKDDDPLFGYPNLNDGCFFKYLTGFSRMGVNEIKDSWFKR